jgi:hypothetical protein
MGLRRQRTGYLAFYHVYTDNKDAAEDRPMEIQEIMMMMMIA